MVIVRKDIFDIIIMGNYIKMEVNICLELLYVMMKVILVN